MAAEDEMDNRSKGDSTIGHVSDTALWVAMYRAMENDRPNPLFKDPLAARLAGERGQQIAESMPGGKLVEWALVVRTVAIDCLISKAIHDGADCVVNLGAGLDSRPYRMRLPSSLRWIEVDFPGIIAMKSELLRDETPVCRLERMAVDLTDREASRALFKSIGAQAQNILVITEGVIYYLSNQEAANLSDDLLAVPSVRHWIHDYRNGMSFLPKKWAKAFKDAPFKFNAPDWVGFFCERGWAIEQRVYADDEARRISRPMPFIFPWSPLISLACAISSVARARMREMSGFVMFKRAVS